MRILCRSQYRSAGGIRGRKAIEDLLKHIVPGGGPPTLPDHGGRTGQDQVPEQTRDPLRGGGRARGDVGHGGLPWHGRGLRCSGRRRCGSSSSASPPGMARTRRSVEAPRRRPVVLPAGHRVGGARQGGIAADPLPADRQQGRTCREAATALTPLRRWCSRGTGECDNQVRSGRLTSIAICYATMPASGRRQSAARQLPSPAAITPQQPLLELDDCLPDTPPWKRSRARRRLAGRGDGPPGAPLPP